MNIDPNVYATALMVAYYRGLCDAKRLPGAKKVADHLSDEIALAMEKLGFDEATREDLNYLAVVFAARQLALRSVLRTPNKEKLPILEVATGASTLFLSLMEGGRKYLATAPAAQIDLLHEVAALLEVPSMSFADDFTTATLDALNPDAYLGTVARWLHPGERYATVAEGFSLFLSQDQQREFLNTVFESYSCRRGSCLVWDVYTKHGLRDHRGRVITGIEKVSQKLGVDIYGQAPATYNALETSLRRTGRVMEVLELTHWSVTVTGIVPDLTREDIDRLLGGMYIVTMRTT